MELFTAPDGGGYATFPVNEHRETHDVRSKGFECYLLERYFRDEGKAPQPNAPAIRSCHLCGKGAV